MAMDERDRERRVERRTGRRIVVGSVVGAIVGAALGLLIGAFVFDPWTAAHWTMALAGAILGGGIMFVQAGMSGLESVDPGREPLARDRPVGDEGSWTSTERDERSA
jgi:VIT1/CCC1 family predicted Fe2+/Mn2+ transporter